MALAESLHHAAPRGQKMARAGGVEREENYEPRLLDPPLPQRAATVGYVAAGAPLPAVSSLRGADGVGGSVVKFFLRAELKKKKEEEERKVQKRLEREQRRQQAFCCDRLAEKERQRTSQRKRKKRRKKKTPRTSSHLTLPPRSSSTTAVVGPWLVLLFWCFSRCIPSFVGRN